VLQVTELQNIYLGKYQCFIDDLIVTCQNMILCK